MTRERQTALNKIIAASAMIAMVGAAVSCGDDDAYREAPKIYFASSGTFEISPDDTLALEPRITYDYGCTYRWTDTEGTTLSTDKEYQFIPPAMKDYKLIFQVSNDLGSDAYEVNISVLLKAGFGDLENFTTKKTSVLALLPDTLPGAFRWNGIEFSNAINSDTSMWYGFAFSNKTSVLSTISNSAMGIAYATSSTTSSSDKSYMAVHAYSDFATIKFGKAYTPKSVDIANDNFIYLASKFGYMSISSAGDTVTVSPAAKNDYYTAVISGLNENGELSGGSVEYKLVDCSFDNPAKYARSTSWTTIDLSGIGTVYGLRMSVETSMTAFPDLFCIDNLRLQD